MVVNYGRDIVKATVDALNASDIMQHLDRQYSVAIKPNLVVARPASEGATTHPEVVEGILLFLKSQNVSNLSIIESAWAGEDTARAFKICGYEALGKKYGAACIDLKKDATVLLKRGGMEIRVCKTALETDFLINVPVLKAHCQTKLTCCMKNLKGCIPDNEKRRFHAMGLHKPIAALNALVKTGYCVVDGICGDLDFEEGGNPVEANRIIAGANPVLVDSYCARLLGYEPEEIGYLSLAKSMGLGDFFSKETKLIELNTGNKPTGSKISSRLAERYKKFIDERDACTACYAALIHALHRLGKTPPETIHIGQGFKGEQENGTGIGNCTGGFSRCVKGCPPKAADIIKFLYA